MSTEDWLCYMPDMILFRMEEDELDYVVAVLESVEIQCKQLGIMEVIDIGLIKAQYLRIAKQVLHKYRVDRIMRTRSL